MRFRRRFGPIKNISGSGICQYDTLKMVYRSTETSDVDVLISTKLKGLKQRESVKQSCRLV